MEDLTASVIIGRYTALVTIRLQCNEKTPPHGTVEITLCNNGSWKLDSDQISCPHCKQKFEALRASNPVEPFAA